jgi:hypothetical protein
MLGYVFVPNHCIHDEDTNSSAVQQPCERMIYSEQVSCRLHTTLINDVYRTMKTI